MIVSVIKFIYVMFMVNIMIPIKFCASWKSLVCKCRQKVANAFRCTDRITINRILTKLYLSRKMYNLYIIMQTYKRMIPIKNGMDWDYSSFRELHKKLERITWYEYEIPELHSQLRFCNFLFCFLQKLKEWMKIFLMVVYKTSCVIWFKNYVLLMVI